MLSIKFGNASEGFEGTRDRISLTYVDMSAILVLAFDRKTAQIVTSIILFSIIVRDFPYGVSYMSLAKIMAVFHAAHSCPQVSSSSTLPTISTPTSSWKVTCFSLPFRFFFPLPFSLFGSLPSSSSKSPASLC
jgi:hypothetical protein